MSFKNTCFSDCGRNLRGPYLTAYQIALKYGFRGTEEQWIRSIGTRRVARVTEISGNTFECDTSLGQVRLALEQGYLVDLVCNGTPAVITDEQDDYISFSTNLLRDENGDYYDVFTLSGRANTWERMRVSGSGESGGIGNKAVHINNLDDDLAGSIALANSAIQTLQHAYGFASQSAYDTFVEDYPAAIQPGDFIYITDRSQNNMSVRVYQRNDLGTLDQIITTIADSYIVTLTESNGTWSADHTFSDIVTYGVNLGKKIIAYLPGIGLYIPADYVFTAGTSQYIQFDAVTLGAAGRMGQSFLITSEGVRADIKALGKFVVHATTQDSGQSYIVDYYASQIIALRQYDANIVLVDGLTGDEYPLIGDNGGTAAYFGGFNRGMTKTVLFAVYNATNVPGKSEAAYSPSGGYSGPTISVPATADDGKRLTGHADGSTSWETVLEVPEPGSGDNGKVLTVVSGLAAWAAIPETTTSEIDAIIAAI